MNLVTGEIVEITSDQAGAVAKVRVGGAYLRVPMMLVREAKLGDTVLIESGVAISRVTSERTKEE